MKKRTNKASQTPSKLSGEIKGEIEELPKSNARNEFRYNFEEKHKNYVFEEKNGKYHAVGLTHKKKTFGKKNMPLKVNPQKGKTKKAYVRNGIVTEEKDNFGRRMNNYQFEDEDFANVKAKIRHYKKENKKKK